MSDDIKSNDTLYHWFINHYNSSPNRIALWDSGELFTYKSFFNKISYLVSLFKEKNIKQNDRIAVIMPNNIEFITSVLSISCINATGVLIDPKSSMKNLRFIIHETEPKLIISNFSNANKIVNNLNMKYENFLVKNGESTEDVKFLTFEKMKNQFSEIDMRIKLKKFDIEDPAVIAYTTGTTGVSKGVVLSHRSLKASAKAMVKAQNLTKNDSVIIFLPLFHMYGFCVFTSHLMVGGKFAIEPNFMYPNKIFERMKSLSINGLPAQPAHFAMILSRFSELIKKYRKNIGWISTASAKMPKENILALRKLLPETDIYIYYALSEAARAVSVKSPDKIPGKLDSIGRPNFGVKVKLVNEKNKVVSPGEIGEITIRGDILFTEYWKRPGLTNKFFKNNTFYTGDFAISDEDGYLHIKGRKDNIINSGGEKFSSLEVKEVIEKHPNVNEAEVIGINDPEKILGQVGVAFIVPKDRRKVTSEELIKFSSKKIEQIKIPRKIFFVDEIPKSSSGKVEIQKLKNHPLLLKYLSGDIK